MARHVQYFASVDPDGGKDTAGADTVGQPLLACGAVCDRARLDHLADTLRCRRVRGSISTSSIMCCEFAVATAAYASSCWRRSQWPNSMKVASRASMIDRRSWLEAAIGRRLTGAGRLT